MADSATPRVELKARFLELEVEVTFGSEGCVLSTGNVIKLAACRGSGQGRRYDFDGRKPLAFINGRPC